MNFQFNESRRKFVVTSAAVTGGMSFGFMLPTGDAFAQVQKGADLSKPEIKIGRAHV